MDLPGANALARVLRAHERSAAASSGDPDADSRSPAGVVPIIAIGEPPVSDASGAGAGGGFSATVPKPLCRDALQVLRI